MERCRDERGFSLIELLVASAILVVALLSLAQLLALATAANASAGRATYAAVLAAQKLESLRAVTWDSLRGQAGESVDYLDRSGARSGPGPAAYTRRWSINPSPADPAGALVIQVTVRGGGEDARLVTVRARRTP